MLQGRKRESALYIAHVLTYRSVIIRAKNASAGHSRREEWQANDLFLCFSQIPKILATSLTAFIRINRIRVTMLFLDLFGP